MTRRSSVIEFRPWKYSVTGLEDYSEQTLTRAEFVLNVVGTAKCASACAELNKIVALAATHSGLQSSCTSKVGQVNLSEIIAKRKLK